MAALGRGVHLLICQGCIQYEAAAVKNTNKINKKQGTEQEEQEEQEERADEEDSESGATREEKSRVVLQECLQRWPATKAWACAETLDLLGEHKFSDFASKIVMATKESKDIAKGKEHLCGAVLLLGGSYHSLSAKGKKDEILDFLFDMGQILAKIGESKESRKPKVGEAKKRHKKKQKKTK